MSYRLVPVAPSLVFLFLFSSPFSSSRVRIWRWNFESLYHGFMGKEALPSQCPPGFWIDSIRVVFLAVVWIPVLVLYLRRHQGERTKRWGACSSGCYAACKENRQPAALAPWPWCAEAASSREVSSGGGCSCSSSSRQRLASSRPASICARPRTAAPRVSSLHGSSSSSNLIVLVDMQIPVTPGDSRGSSSGCMFGAQQLFDELPN